jgi:DNA-binding transcriptional LysR family regulator
LQEGRKGNLVLGASTTISQYVLPALLADFLSQYPNNRIQSFQSNSRSIEEQLIDKTLDLGITEGSTDNRALKYIPFMKDELVLVTNSQNPLLAQLKIQYYPISRAYLWYYASRAQVHEQLLRMH